MIHCKSSCILAVSTRRMLQACYAL
jgi:hypothetical protein